MRDPRLYRKPAAPPPPDPVELAAIERGDRGFGAMVRLLRECEQVPAAAVLRLVPGATEADLARLEAGVWRPTVDWVRAYSMCTTATFTMLFDVWDREAPCADQRMTVAEACAMVTRLMETAAGCMCPVCGASAAARKRTINAPVASFVSWLARSYTGSPLNALGWVDTHEQLSRGGTYARARHWGLASRERGEEPLWTPTEHGRRWAFGLAKVHRQAVLFRGAVLRFEGPMVAIFEVTDGEEIQRGLARAPMLPGMAG